MIEQLPLGLGPDKTLGFDNFYVAAANRLLVNQLQLQARGEGEQWVYVHGAPESGRSHLLQASCQSASRHGLQAVYLPLAELREFDPAALFEGVEHMQLLCIDDIDVVVGDPAWEQALFNVYNRLYHSGCAMLVAAERASAALGCRLPDLQSRLNSFSVYHLRALGDTEKLQALQLRAGCLGLSLSSEVAEYLYHRAERRLSTLFAALDRLDGESLRQKRPLTKPFIRSVMGW